MDKSIHKICELEEKLAQGFKFLKDYRNKLNDRKAQVVRHLTDEDELQKNIDETLDTLFKNKSTLMDMLNLTIVSIETDLFHKQNELDKLRQVRLNTYEIKFKTLDVNYLNLQLQTVKEFLNQIIEK